MRSMKWRRSAPIPKRVRPRCRKNRNARFGLFSVSRKDAKTRRKMFGPSGLISDQRHVGRSARSGELLRGTRDPLASWRLFAHFSGSVGWALRARPKAPTSAWASAAPTTEEHQEGKKG